jgi:hypothetical protein
MCESAEDHDATLMDLAQEFDNVPEWAQSEESMAESLGVTISDDGAEEDNAPEHDGAHHNAESLTMDELKESEEAVVEALREGDYNNPKIVEEQTYEALESRVGSLESMMQEKLVEETGLSEDTVEAMPFEAMAKEFETEEGDFDAEALVQTPETESVDEEPEDKTEALSEDADKEKAEALYADYQSLPNAPSGLEDDIVEALGVEDFDKATEVLE